MKKEPPKTQTIKFDEYGIYSSKATHGKLTGINIEYHKYGNGEEYVDISVSNKFGKSEAIYLTIPIAQIQAISIALEKIIKQ